MIAYVGIGQGLEDQGQFGDEHEAIVSCGAMMELAGVGDGKVDLGVFSFVEQVAPIRALFGYGLLKFFPVGHWVSFRYAWQVWKPALLMLAVASWLLCPSTIWRWHRFGRRGLLRVLY